MNNQIKSSNQNVYLMVFNELKYIINYNFMYTVNIKYIVIF